MSIPSDHPAIDVSAFAAVTADIARTLESPGIAEQRIRHALMLARTIIPYDRAALLCARVQQWPRLIVVPAVEGDELQQFRVRVEQLWLRVLGTDIIRDSPIEQTIRIALPVVGGDAVTGMLLFEHIGRAEYGAHHLLMMSAVASQIGSYMSLVRESHQAPESPVPDVAATTGHEQPREVPLRCPQCDQLNGVPYRARTIADAPHLISLGVRCRGCHHEWNEDVPTAAASFT